MGRGGGSFCCPAAWCPSTCPTQSRQQAPPTSIPTRRGSSCAWREAARRRLAAPRGREAPRPITAPPPRLQSIAATFRGLRHQPPASAIHLILAVAGDARSAPPALAPASAQAKAAGRRRAEGRSSTRGAVWTDWSHAWLTRAASNKRLAPTRFTRSHAWFVPPSPEITPLFACPGVHFFFRPTVEVAEFFSSVRL